MEIGPAIHGFRTIDYPSGWHSFMAIIQWPRKSGAANPATASRFYARAPAIRVRVLAIATIFLMVVFSVHAEFAGFEAGNGVALTGGVVRVTYNGSKMHSMVVAPGFRVSVMEVKITFVNGTTKRNTMLFAGKHALRAPLPIEVVEILGSLCLLALLCGIVAVLSSTFRLSRADPGAAQNGVPAPSPRGPGVAARPPSVG